MHIYTYRYICICIYVCIGFLVDSLAQQARAAGHRKAKRGGP